jgi:hypothetical protein
MGEAQRALRYCRSVLLAAMGSVGTRMAELHKGYRQENQGSVVTVRTEA